MKTLKNFINESKKRFKQFEEIEYGDKGEDYNGDIGVVEYIGTAEEMAEMDKQGSLQELIDDGIFVPEDDAVLVKMKNGEKLAYIYGDDGFQCYK